jgi:ATP-binding cassette, subfamily B, bacterial
VSTADVRLSSGGLLRWSFASTRTRTAAFVGTLLVVWACEIALPFFLGRTVDAGLERNGEDVVRFGFIMLAVTGVLYGMHVVYLRLEADLVARATFRLRGLVYSRLVAQPLSYFARHKGNELGHRLMADTEVLDKHAIYLVSDLPFAVLTVLGVVCVMTWAHPGLALLVVIFLASAAVVSHRVGHPLASLEKSANALYARLGGRLQEIISGIRTVKVFGRERHELDRLDSLGEELVAAEIRSGRISARLEPLLELVEVLGLVTVVWCGAYLLYQGTLTAGELVAFIAYMELLAEPLSQGGRYYRQFQQCRGTLGRVVELLKGMTGPARRAGASVAGRLAIEIRNVSFAYPETSRAAVRDVSFQAAPGEIIGIVGPNGAGKSTLLDLVLGFQEPQAGRVLAGGVALDEWDERAWREAVGMMSQDVFLFHASLAENIRYGRLDASDEEVARAAERAGLQPLVKRLPEGLATMVGDRGAKISGGERQRVSLARTLLRDPQVLIFDEPTAALDGSAMRDAHRLIQEEAAERVTLVVAHRYETIAVCTRIIVLDQGQVVSQGTLAEVEAGCELFRSLFKRVA